jgi:hypothetical protein
LSINFSLKEKDKNSKNKSSLINQLSKNYLIIKSEAYSKVKTTKKKTTLMITKMNKNNLMMKTPPAMKNKATLMMKMKAPLDKIKKISQIKNPNSKRKMMTMTPL